MSLQLPLPSSDMKLFDKIDCLPPVPAGYVDQALDCIADGAEDISGYHRMMPGFQGRTVIKNNQEFVSARSRRFDLGAGFQTWVRDHIVDDFNSASVSVTEAVSEHWGPHTDVTSRFNLMYVLKTGGPHCATHWWREKKSHLNSMPPPGYYVNDYDLLEKIDHLQMVPHQWYWIDQRYLHSVENLQDTRVTLHVRLADIAGFQQRWGR